MPQLRHNIFLGQLILHICGLFCHLKTDLRVFDFSHLAIRQAWAMSQPSSEAMEAVKTNNLAFSPAKKWE
jgi:hypothetical protein